MDSLLMDLLQGWATLSTLVGAGIVTWRMGQEHTRLVGPTSHEVVACAQLLLGISSSACAALIVRHLLGSFASP